MRNTMRTYLVGLLSLTMTFNPAAACHFCGGGWGGHRYYGPVYYGPVAYGGGCGGCGCEVVVDDCSGCHPCGGCGSSVTVVKESAPAENMPQPTPAPSTNVQPAIPALPQQPAHVDRPVDNAPAPQLPVNPPMPPQAEPPLPNQENAPPMPPANDLFNSAPAPTTPPAPAAEKPSAEAPAAAPAKAAAATDDLFGTTPAKTAEPAAAPAEKPADKPAEPPAATPPAPATPPAADDLFGGATKPAEKAAAPAATPAETPAAPAAKPADKPADKPAGEEKKADDIFGASPSVLREAGGLASNEMRMWVDNTGNFSCRGRLVRFLDGQVRLVKDNGRTTTVSLARLSANDLEFVERQASAHQASAFQTAHSMGAMPWMSN